MPAKFSCILSSTTLALLSALSLPEASAQTGPQSSSGPDLASAAAPAPPGVTASASLAPPASSATTAASIAPQPVPGALQEVTVTATRVSASIQRIPLSVSALTQDQLTTRNIEDIADIAAITPGLQFTTPNPYMSTISEIAIRGLNTVTGASVVGIYLDDTPIMSRISPVGNIGSPYPVVFDLKRVEINRGPQGTLFGAGSEAGTVRFITNEPSLTHFSGFASAKSEFTRDGDPSEELGAAAGGPLIDSVLGFRLSAWDRHDGGYVDRIDQVTGATAQRRSNTDDKLALRAALAYQPTTDLRISPSLDYQSVHTGDNGRIWAEYSNPNTDALFNGAWLPDASTDSFTLPTLKIESHLPLGELTFTTSYFNRKMTVTNDQSAFLSAFGVVDYGSPLGPGFSTSPADAAPTTTGLWTRALTEELRISSNTPGALVTWVAGIFNDHRSQRDVLDFHSITAEPGVDIGYFDQRIFDQQTALFAQVDLHFTPNWTLTVGAREAHVVTKQTNVNGNGIFNAGTPSFVDTGNLSQNPFTPHLSISYQATPNHMLYASVGKGFRVGGGNEPVPTLCNFTVPSGYGSDFVWSYEVGAKDTLFHHRLQVDASAFHVDWSQIQQIVQLQCGQQYTTNAGKAESNGFDLALEALVTDNLRAELNLGYVNAFYTQNVFDQAGQPIVLAGDKIGLLPQVNPPWDVDAAVTYSVPLPREDALSLRLEYQYHSRNPGPFISQIQASPNYFPLDVPDPATHLLNARADFLAGALDVGVFINNVTNSHPMIGESQFSGLSNLITYSTFRPRTIGLSLNLTF